MFTFRTFSEIPLQDTLAAWNAGFQDYYANLQMDCRTFLGRFHREDLLPEESVMLYFRRAGGGLYTERAAYGERANHGLERRDCRPSGLQGPGNGQTSAGREHTQIQSRRSEDSNAGSLCAERACDCLI
ncbi:hypothetical protein D3C75_1091440 [compost metagenome]